MNLLRKKLEKKNSIHDSLKQRKKPINLPWNIEHLYTENFKTIKKMKTQDIGKTFHTPGLSELIL